MLDGISMNDGIHGKHMSIFNIRILLVNPLNENAFNKPESDTDELFFGISMKKVISLNHKHNILG